MNPATIVQDEKMKRFEKNWAMNIADNLTNAANLPLLSLEAESETLEIKPDSQVKIGYFRPDKFLSYRFYAHTNTIRAVRKELFLISKDTVDLALEMPCQKCKKVLDWQFWQHCPHCEAKMPHDFKNPKFSTS